MNITFSNQRHATLTNKQTQSKTQSKLKNSDCIHYIIDHVAFFQFFFLGMSLVIQPCKPHRWHKNKCSGCQKGTFDTFLFRIGSDDTKYLCSNCRKGHDHTVPLLGNIDCVLTKWPTWGAGCCSVKLFADKGAEFTVGVYKYEHGVDGCVPSEVALPWYRIQTRLYIPISKSSLTNR